MSLINILEKILLLHGSQCRDLFHAMKPGAEIHSAVVAVLGPTVWV
jgi:hypothetical protein